MRSSTKRQLIMVTAAVITGAALAGCGTILSKPAVLDHARATYDSAKINQEISTLAPGPLYEAEKSLQAAENAWQNDRDEKAVEHYAYLVEKKIEIAKNIAERMLTEDSIKNIACEREMAMLELRTREAEARQRQAMEALILAENRARAAEEARDKAEAALQATEKVRQKQLAAHAKLQSLAQKMSDLKTKKTERGLVLTLDGVLFATGQAEIKPLAWPSLQNLVNFLKENPERQADIEGHTDNVGKEEANRILSQRRAEAVRDFIINHGITVERITARGLGEKYPVVSNNTEAGRKQNRRVEIIIPDKQ
jgi:outer membrane protein OmpA-like peptidoglycan-associated protein